MEVSVQSGAGHADLPPHRFDYPVAESGRKGEIKHCSSISLMGMQTDLSVPGGLARLAPHHFISDGFGKNTRGYQTIGV
jgi:hypothetical protein